MRPQQPLDASAPPCTSGFARTEGQAATGVANVDQVYDHTGDAVTMYAGLGVDLTALVGRDVGGTPKLAATVRHCYTGDGSCPYQNAFWNGEQTYYGINWTNDETVGHEWTHGVIDRNSALFYWGQSGAINESMADVMGEIVDHRISTAGDSPTNWDIGEDTPHPAAPFRNMANPTLEATRTGPRARSGSDERL